LDRVDRASATNRKEVSQMPARPKTITVGPIEATGGGGELGRAADRLCIDTIRTLAMDAVQQANSRRPGAPMALAPVAYTLWQHFFDSTPMIRSGPIAIASLSNEVLPQRERRMLRAHLAALSRRE
jgi:hypothetical protein